MAYQYHELMYSGIKFENPDLFGHDWEKFHLWPFFLLSVLRHSQTDLLFYKVAKIFGLELTKKIMGQKGQTIGHEMFNWSI